MKLLNVLALVVLMLSIGMQVTIEQVLASLGRHRQVALGIVANFVLVPLATVMLLAWFQPSPLVSAGFLILAVCPGAPMGPAFTAAANGDVALATGLMFVLAGLSAVVAPLSLMVALPWLLPPGELSFDYLALVKMLVVTQALPLATGLAIHRWLPRATERVRKPIAVAASVLLLAAVVAILATQFQTLATIHTRGWFGMTILLTVSLAAGWLCGGRQAEVQRALAVTTGLRNAAVGLVIVGSCFAGTPAVTAVVAYALVAIIGTRLFAAVIGTRPLAH